ncbi:hypothetical protein [Marimonas arenosa]|uniref:Tail fiber domain-containing protein n=1 Tax=Marimonas arenosa TaxID=1795305 RepID=A0AAE3WD21_9RHOB|nr:hypothetical protein [Marimonas arenosa]MDQ2090263.1 hypothetical protein [Marimonas arenosa]
MRVISHPGTVTRTVGLVLAFWAGSAAADNVINQNTVIRSQLCVGLGCADVEAYDASSATLRIKYQRNRIELDDTSTSVGYPNNDWALLFNDNDAGGLSYFTVSDETADRRPFTVEAGALDNTLWVGTNGRVGIGTSMPETGLHIAKGGYPSIKLEDLGQAVGMPYSWRIVASEYGFVVTDQPTGDSPFLIYAGADDRMFHIDPTGVGIGGFFGAEAPLHVWRNDGTSQLRVEEAAEVTGPRTLVNLRNNGRPEIVMANTDTGGEWSFGAGTNFVLKQGAVGSDSSAKTKLFEVQSSGDAVLAGTLTTGGTTCGGGCDLVFSDDYDLPSIAEHTERMFALGHLPNVGPTHEGKPINVTDKLGRVLNELEHAHIYIAQQQRVIEDLTKRLAALEAR